MLGAPLKRRPHPKRSPKPCQYARSRKPRHSTGAKANGTAQ